MHVHLEYEEKIIRESSQKVFDYAKKLKEDGKIKDCTYCEQSNVVALFYEDNETSLYIPKINETYTGDNKEFSVTSVETLPSLDKVIIDSVDQFSKFRITGAEEAAKLVDNSYEEYTSHNKIHNKAWESMDDVVKWMGSLSENNTRVILWRGHGTVFVTPEGELLAVWCLPIKWDKNNDKYLDEEYSLLTSGDYCVISSNFWKKYCDEVDGGLFFTVSCNTGADSGYAAKIFFDKGFSTYAAPNGSIWTTYADKMMGRTIEYMCGKVDEKLYNFDEAISKAKEDINDTDIYGVTIVHANADQPFELVPKSEEEIFREYFKTLIKEYGLTKVKQKGTMYDPMDEWFNPKGILSAIIYDLDRDNHKEALVARVIEGENSRDDYVLLLEVYEIENNEVVLASSITMDEVSWGKNSFTDSNTHVNIIETDKGRYIFCEQYSSAGYFADGTSKDYWALKYDDELEMVVAFCQTAGGSSDFAYTGYEYKDGKVVNEKVLFDEMSGHYNSSEEAKNAYQNAISGWFGKYKIYVTKGLKSGYQFTGESILSSKNKIIPVTDYVSKCVDYSFEVYNTICKFEAVLTDHTNIRDIE